MLNQPLGPIQSDLRADETAKENDNRDGGVNDGSGRHGGFQLRRSQQQLGWFAAMRTFRRGARSLGGKFDVTAALLAFALQVFAGHFFGARRASFLKPRTRHRRRYMYC